MDEYSQTLIETAERVTPGWINRLVAQRVSQNDEIRAATDEAADRATEFVVARLTHLMLQDVDEQVSTPLAIMRETTKFPTQVLIDAGAQPVERDDQARKLFPEDVYDLVPANWGDIDEALVEPGLAWGAAKVMAHRLRHGG